MKQLFLMAAVAAAIGAVAPGSAQAHSRHHVNLRHWCAVHHCEAPPVRRHYPVLDGTEPLCGFNDGTYLRNRMECGFN